MSRLRIFDKHDPRRRCWPVGPPRDDAALDGIGVAFEQWEAAQPVLPARSAEAIMDAYRADIDRLVTETNGFNSVDVVSIAPGQPEP